MAEETLLNCVCKVFKKLVCPWTRKGRLTRERLTEVSRRRCFPVAHLLLLQRAILQLHSAQRSKRGREVLRRLCLDSPPLLPTKPGDEHFLHYLQATTDDRKTAPRITDVTQRSVHQFTMSNVAVEQQICTTHGALLQRVHRGFSDWINF